MSKQGPDQSEITSNENENESESQSMKQAEVMSEESDDNNLMGEDKSSLQIETALNLDPTDLDSQHEQTDICEFFEKIAKQAQGDCEKYYKKALQFSMNIPIMNPLYLYLNLNWAIYMFEV